jgi:hypothetical protein
MVTDSCPCGERCESCGSENGPMAVVEVKIGPDDAAEFCLTSCRRCAVALTHGVPAPITSATVGRLITEHAEHMRHAAQR